MGSDTDTVGNLIARIAIEQILARNENGNLFPLTSMEIQVLTDLHELVSADEEENEEETHPTNEIDPEPERESSKKEDKRKLSQKPDPGTAKGEFKKLNTSDLTD